MAKKEKQKPEIKKKKVKGDVKPEVKKKLKKAAPEKKVKKAASSEKPKHIVAPYDDTYIEPGTGVARNHCAITEPLTVGKSLVPSMAKINAKKKDFTAVSFFAGCGGASTGMKMAGFNVLFSNEFVPPAQDTYRLNHPGTILDGSDIRKLDPKEILKRIGLKKGELDHLDGSPPCKAFSMAGIQDDGWNKEVLYSDGIYQRVDDLFDENIRMIKGMMPKTFLLENVGGLVCGVSRGMFVEILDDLRKCGYRVKAALINPTMLGVPQTRERTIILGVRNDLKMDPVFPKPLKKIVTVRDVLPNVLRIKTTVKGLIKYVSSDRPSPTIVASDYDTSETASFSCGGWCEDDQGRTRKYTLRELRRIMCFPDDFKLSGTPREQWERLGRSHVPLQVYHLMMALRKNVLEPYYEKKGAKFTDNII